MPLSSLSYFVGLTEILVTSCLRYGGKITFIAEKQSKFEVCPSCVSKCSRVYDRRIVNIRDAPLRNHVVYLQIKKRRFKCDCGKVFTEPVFGIKKRGRTTERFRRACVAAAAHYSSLSGVCKELKCSSGYIYKSLYTHLKRKTKEQARDVFPKIVGLDEHSFKRNSYGRMDFVTMVVAVGPQKKRLVDVVQGKRVEQLKEGLAHLSGADGVRAVVLDMSKTYKSFAKEAFPNADLVADKFHVVRLLGPVVMKYRRQICASRKDYATRAARQTLLRSVSKLDYDLKKELLRFLESAPELATVWRYYQRILRLYRTRGYKKASKAFGEIVDDLSKETIPELKRFRRTLLTWRTEILNYFIYKITNARCEGFNNRAKVLKKQAYGFRSFFNYRLRILSSCY